MRRDYNTAPLPARHELLTLLAYALLLTGISETDAVAVAGCGLTDLRSLIEARGVTLEIEDVPFSNSATSPYRESDGVCACHER
jgi:hypothetical protein